MPAEFSWSRVLEAAKDARFPFKGAKAVTSGIVALLAVLGYTAAAIWKPETYLPPTNEGIVFLATAALVAAVWPVVVAYRLRTVLRKLQDEISALSAEDRALILQLQTVAGRALHRYTDVFFAGSIKDNTDAQKLHNLCGELYRYRGIYSTGTRLATLLSLFSISLITVKELPEVVATLEESYKSFSAECESILKPSIDPQPSKASEPNPQP